MTNPPSHSVSGVTDAEVEAAAQRIFEHWQFDKPVDHLPAAGKPAWVHGGNSIMQDKARDFARAALEAASRVSPSLKAKTWTDAAYLLSIIDSAIEDGFDPDEDGHLLDEIRAELRAGVSPVPSGAGEVVTFEWTGDFTSTKSILENLRQVFETTSGMTNEPFKAHYQLQAKALGEAIAALSPPQGHVTVPVGWKLVPVEPTPEMVRVAISMYAAMLPESEWPFTVNLYRAMLAALPHNHAETKAASSNTGGSE